MPVCIFCSKKSQPLTELSEITLNKCKSVLLIRKQNHLASSDVLLPEKVGENHAFHRNCYQRFCALPPKHRQSQSKSNADETETCDLRAEVSTTNEPSSSQSSVTQEKIVDEMEVAQSEREKDDDESISSDDLTSQITDDKSNESQGCMCIICTKARKRIKGRDQPLSECQKDTIRTLKSYAIDSENTDLLDRLSTQEALNKAIYYHPHCKRSLHNQVISKDNERSEKSEWHKNRNTHKSAFNVVAEYVEENVIRLGQCYFLTFLKTMYVDHVKTKLPNYVGVIEIRDLEERLLALFPRKIAIVSLEKKKVIKPFSGVLLKSSLDNIEKRDILNRAAMILRSEITKIEKKSLPDRVTATNLISGECTVPDIIRDFYSTLISTSARRRISEMKQRLANSFSEDLIYAVSNGTLKTSKHITLGMTMKSLTNSKQVINILNRLGHCCSYTVLEELETEATLSSMSQSDICPEDIVRLPNLQTGLAFNNFDRHVDTSTGKDTLHDTVGIIFQNLTDVSQLEENSDTTNTQSSDIEQSLPAGPSRKRQRSLDAVTFELAPYNKKPKYKEKLLDLHSNLRANDDDIVPALRNLFHTWMMCHQSKLPGTPAWVGFNSLIHKDTSVQQKVSYLTTINSSPTNNAVVLETMHQALKTAVECHMDYIEVTYDLAIAKIALQIQSMEKPKFDRLFIHVGTFHVMMAFFKAVGKFIDGCGITNIMVNSEILASGSVNTFLTGKHFNRCKKLHPLLSLALQILHFENFLAICEIEINDDLKSYLVDFTKTQSVNPKIENRRIIQILDEYKDYRTKTLLGEHGKTAQFYMMYVEYIDYYLILNYGIRLGNFEILKYVLPLIGSMFFCFNQQNYSRYTVLYHEKLIKVEQTHPGLELQLEKGSFGVKRTPKPFSRQPIDLTLEQTINADAANKLTGISYLTNTISARQRWCKSHSIRSSIISHVMDRAGLRKNQDVTADLEISRIKKHSAKLQNLMTHIKQNINPFSDDLDKNSLYNISTGQSVNERIEKFLLNATNLGQQQRDKFIEECCRDESRFENPIKKNSILTFVDAVAKKKIAMHGKVIEIKMQRNLFGKLLRLSLAKNLDLNSVLSYPLTPIPLSLCHVDGAICKTDKSVLFKVLENEIKDELVSDTCEVCDIMIFDGFFVIHQMKDLPLTFGSISKQILKAFTASNASEIVIVFDRYFTPSIKDSEHVLRGRIHGNKFDIRGPEQKRPSNFSNELKNIYFKDALVKFLCDDWSQDYMAAFIGNKNIFVNYESCLKFTVSDNKVIKTIEEELSCPLQEEADTKIIYHICQIDLDRKVTVRCSDTDILIILLGNMHALKGNLHIQFLVGTGNNRRYVDVTKLYETLGESLCKALPAFHALTGCDFNPAFYRKGKKKPLHLLRKSPKYISALMNLSQLSVEDLEDYDFSEVEEFVCRIYGHNKINDINVSRAATFMKAYKFNDKDEVLKLDQNFEGSMLPPCKSELRQQILRTSYIAQLWSNAHLSIPTLSSPKEFGWKEEDNKYNFIWFEGDQLPRIDEIATEITDTLEDSVNDDQQEAEKHPDIDELSDSSSEEDDGNDSDSD